MKKLIIILMLSLVFLSGCTSFDDCYKKCKYIKMGEEEFQFNVTFKCVGGNLTALFRGEGYDCNVTKYKWDEIDSVCFDECKLNDGG